MEVYTAKNLSFTYKGTEKKALKNLNFSLEEGDFLLLFGASGSGKTTLLRLLKKELMPNGKTEGELLYKGKAVSTLSDDVSVREIGYTAQNPDTQSVSEYVKNELEFLLRNLSCGEDEIALRVAETVSFFGTQKLYHEKIETLSGGEKQTVNLESVFVSAPRVLLLDEPLSQLDPFSAERFLAALRKIKEELSVTVILSEHNIEPLLPLANKVFYLEEGEGDFLQSMDAFLHAHPEAAITAQIPKLLGIPPEITVPKTVSECRMLLHENDKSQKRFAEYKKEDETQKEICLSFKNVSFRYEKEGEDILSDLDFRLVRGEIFTIVGANGAGKSTLLKLISQQLKPYAGKIKKAKEIRIASVPQNPQAVFSFDSVLEVLEAVQNPPTLKEVYLRFKEKEPAKAMAPSADTLEIAERLGITDTLYQNPFDLSGGQQQRVAIARALLQKPDILLFDEATKGLEKARKQELLHLLCELKAEGMAILCVTHDLDFAAESADRVALLFDGKLLGTRRKHDFFTENSVYTSTVAKIFLDVPKDERPVSMEEVRRAVL